jgi:hypothetical protein
MRGSARFEPASGLYEWTPTDRDLGPTEISFTARNSLDVTVTKTVTIYVVPAQPVLTGFATGAPMAIAVEVGGHTSNQLRTVMRQTAPGLFSGTPARASP